MAAPKISPYPHIVRNPDILGGEPTIAGARIAVRNIIERARYMPVIEELCATYPHLTPAEVEEAFAFYREHHAAARRNRDTAGCAAGVAGHPRRNAH